MGSFDDWAHRKIRKSQQKKAKDAKKAEAAKKPAEPVEKAPTDHAESRQLKIYADRIRGTDASINGLPYDNDGSPKFPGVNTKIDKSNPPLNKNTWDH